MSKCNSCKNPVAVSSITCEWCGAPLVRDSVHTGNATTSPIGGLVDFMARLNEVDNQIVEANSGAGTWGALDGILNRAFGNSKIDSLNQQKVTIIQTYPLPKAANDLLEIASMAVSNFKNLKIHKLAFSDNARDENKMNQPLKNAWKSKAEQALNLLDIYARSDEFVRQQAEALRSQLSEEKKGWL